MKPSVPSAVPPSRHRLPGGMRLGFIALPPGSQAAALVRVHAGAHDAPLDYPGLAHFLEHLLFLGSHGYPQAQSLMPFVQGCGGQLNASTRERHTDFFFQVPSDAFDDALKRLLDMLARPLLDPAAQLREREVLQAEFLARGRDRETLCDAAIGTALGEAHPFAAFHAGNRETLPVEDETFQRALHGYHRRFYQTGQLELLIAAPFALQQVLQTLDCPECQLLGGEPVTRSIPPLRMAEGPALRLQVAGARPCLNLAFALDGLPGEAAVALDLLGEWLASQAPDSLLARLREPDWCDRVTLRVPYWHRGQGVAVVELQLTDQGIAARTQVVAAVQQWLRFMTSEAAWAAVWDEYVQIRQRGLLGREPLSLLRYWVDPAAWTPTLDAQRVRQGLEALGEQLHRNQPLILTVDDEDGDLSEPIEPSPQGFALRLSMERLVAHAAPDWQWRLPSHNRWLSERLSPRRVTTEKAGLRWLAHGDGEASGGLGALYLRWRFAAQQPVPGLWYVLQAALQPYTLAAEQAGVELRFENYGRSWCLALFGYAEALPVILRDLKGILKQPPAAVFDQGRRLLADAVRPGADEILIRQLLRRLPVLLEPPVADGGGELDQSALAQAWHLSQWDALAVGLPMHLSGPLHDVLDELPGVATPLVQRDEASPARYRWCRFGDPGTETALVLFCPLPSRTPAVEAAWRQLARLMEGAFFRRLRSELQLGYAVFCGFRQFGGQGGLVFAVQSPSATAGELLRHIEAFLESFAGQLDDQPTRASQASGAPPGGSDIRRHAEANWQAQLAGCDAGHPVAVAAAMAQLDSEALRLQLRALRAADGGWIVVSNADAADTRWHSR